jgi:hypothetical protein
MSIGYSQSCEDACFFFKGDLNFLITSNKLSEIEDLIGHLERKYRSVTVNIGDKHEYLGANIDFSTPHHGEDNTQPCERIQSDKVCGHPCC